MYLASGVKSSVDKQDNNNKKFIADRILNKVDRISEKQRNYLNFNLITIFDLFQKMKFMICPFKNKDYSELILTNSLNQEEYYLA